MKAPVSLCIIVKNEPLLERCLQSIKDHVSEIIVIDTGSSDDNSFEVAKKYADRYEVFLDCNNPETGLIEDFSMARQRSFDLATQPFVMWADADDIIEGGENLLNITKRFENVKNADGIGILFPYEYAYDSLGNCTLRHYRERLILNKKCFKWSAPVHECLTPKSEFNVVMLSSEELVFKHQRQYSERVPEKGRNLRILKNYYDKTGEAEARTLYYLGLEYYYSNMLEEAIKFFTRYIEISGWEDEKTLACLNLVDIYQSLNKYDLCLKWAFKAIETKENWAEGYFALSRIYYFIAKQGGPNELRNWERCAFFAQQGLQLPPTKTLLFINPLERDVEIYRYLTLALDKIGNRQGAYESVLKGLEKNPTDPSFVFNRKLYESVFAKQKIAEGAQELLRLEELSENTVSTIINLIEKRSSVLKLDDKLPSEKLLIEASKENKLNIVFFAGQGVEDWNPITIERDGPAGGSELMLYEMARRMAKMGHTVTVYCGCGTEDNYDGVRYLSTRKFHDLECDVLVVSRRADYLDDRFNVTAKLRLLWVHDLVPINFNNQLLLKADRILALSEFHKKVILDNCYVNKDHVLVTRNGIDVSAFDGEIKRDRFKCINASSPDRSWPILLNLWPEIKKRVPEASLHLFYGFNNWICAAKNDINQMALINRLKFQIQTLKSQDIVFHDKVNQKTLIKEMMSAGCYLHPNWFQETSGINFMQSLASGLRIVASRNGALPETVGDCGILLDGEWTSPEYGEKFINAAVECLSREDDTDRKKSQQYAKERFCLDALAREWEETMYSLLEKIKINPIVPFQTIR